MFKERVCLNEFSGYKKILDGSFDFKVKFIVSGEFIRIEFVMYVIYLFFLSLIFCYELYE